MVHYQTIVFQLVPDLEKYDTLLLSFWQIILSFATS